MDRAVPLTEYAWKVPNLGEPQEPSLEEAEEAQAIAKELCEAVLTRLPQECGP